MAIEAARERAASAGDETLVRRAASGDAAAFEMLVADRLDRCYRLAWSILANDADAADATQDGFVAAWRQLPRLRDMTAFDGWLNRIVANAALMARRHRKRLREVRVEPAGDAGEFDPRSSRAFFGSPEIDAVTETDAIHRAFARLRPHERAILTLHHVDDRPLAEIARTLGIPLGTAKWRLHDARKALGRAMEAEA